MRTAPHSHFGYRSSQPVRMGGGLLSPTSGLAAMRTAVIGLLQLESGWWGWTPRGSWQGSNTLKHDARCVCEALFAARRHLSRFLFSFFCVPFSSQLAAYRGPIKGNLDMEWPSTRPRQVQVQGRHNAAHPYSPRHQDTKITTAGRMGDNNTCRYNKMQSKIDEIYRHRRVPPFHHSRCPLPIPCPLTYCHRAVSCHPWLGRTADSPLAH